MQSETLMKFDTLLNTKKFKYEWTVKEWSSVKQVKVLNTENFKLPEIEKTCYFEIEVCSEHRDYYYFTAYVDAFKPSNLCTVTLYLNEKKITSKYDSVNKNYYVYCPVRNVENDSLTVFYEICYVLNTRATMKQSRGLAKVCSNLNIMYKNKVLCDVTFLVGTKKFEAHAAVLASASLYFITMFKNENFLESKNRIVDFRRDTDITEENFSGFLEFIYECKPIFELKTIVMELLILADKFDVKALHEACEYHISENINTQNVIKTLFLSDKYHCHILKKKAIMYAKNNIAVVKTSKEFEDLCKNADLMKSLL